MRESLNLFVSQSELTETEENESLWNCGGQEGGWSSLLIYQSKNPRLFSTTLEKLEDVLADTNRLK